MMNDDYTLTVTTGLTDTDGTVELTATVVRDDSEAIDSADPADFVTTLDMDVSCDMVHSNVYGDVAVYGEFGHDTYGVTFADYPSIKLCARGGLDAASRLAKKFHAGWRPVNWPVAE